MLTPLLSPRAGTPEISADESSFEKVINSLLAGSGPIAIDAERASGYRYSQRAYLIQIFRKDGGLHLIDPIPLKGSKLWQVFNDNFANIEWVIHAISQPSCPFARHRFQQSFQLDNEGLDPFHHPLDDFPYVQRHQR